MSIHPCRSSSLRCLSVVALAACFAVVIAGCPSGNGDKGPFIVALTGPGTVTGASGVFFSKVGVGDSLNVTITAQARESGQTITLDIELIGGTLTTAEATINNTLPASDSGTDEASIDITGVANTIGTIQLKYTATDPDGEETVIVHEISIEAGEPNDLVITQQPTDVDIVDAISPAVTVEAQDENGDTVTGFTQVVTIKIGTNPGSGTLSGTLSVAAVGGVATFSDLTINALGTGYTLIAESDGLDAVESGTFDVTADGPRILTLSPDCLRANGTVTITGVNFDETPGNNTVTFDSVAGTVDTASATELSVTLPGTLNAGDCVVTVDSDDSNAVAYELCPTRVSVDSAEQEVDTGAHNRPVVSLDGRYIVFHSDATDLVSDDTNGQTDVFLRDRTAGTTIRISQDDEGDGGNFASINPSISSDGKKIVFESSASNLVDGDGNGVKDIFLYDVDLGTLELISIATDGTEASADCANPVISGDGLFVVFQSAATSLDTTKTTNFKEIWLRDLTEETTKRVSVDDEGTEGTNDSYMPTITSDGTLVCFVSEAPNLIESDLNNQPDVFVVTVATGAIERVSLVDDESEVDAGVPTETEANAANTRVAMISGSGDHVVFLSDSTDLGGPAAVVSVFLRDLVNDTTVIVSTDTGASNDGDMDSTDPFVTTDGGVVFFASASTNLVASDDNTATDIFKRDVGGDTTTRLSVTAADAQVDGDSQAPSASKDGVYVVFSSDATDVVTGDTNSQRDIFLTTG